jgi:hypothetical protein
MMLVLSRLADVVRVRLDDFTLLCAGDEPEEMPCSHVIGFLHLS